MRITEIKLPDGLISISEEAFKGCIKLRHINLPDSLVEIGKKAFEDCSSLIAITLPKGLKVLCNEVLRGCSHLEKINIPSSRSELQTNGRWKYTGLQKLGEESLRHCRSLTNITLPASLRLIDSHAFRGCKLISSIECLAPNPPIAMPNSFAGVDTENVVLYVPTQQIAKYREANGWNKFKIIKGKDDSDIFV